MVTFEDTPQMTQPRLGGKTSGPSSIPSVTDEHGNIVQPGNSPPPNPNLKNRYIDIFDAAS